MMSASPNTTEVALKVRLSADARERLIERAALTGRPLDDYASELLERAASALSVDEMLAPLRREFAQSGTTDEQLVDEINAAREDYHRERREAPGV
jgi:hypothetical protein